MPLCEYTDPNQGVGDYEAYLDPACAQEWSAPLFISVFGLTRS